MKWLYVLFAGALVLGGGVVGVLAFFDESPVERISVPEAVEPVLLVDAYRLNDRDTKAVILRDAEGHEFDFRLTQSETERHDDGHNRLNLRVGDSRRVIPLQSTDEARLKRALVLAILYRHEHPVVNEFAPETPDRQLMYAEAALERFSHLGKPWPY